MRGFLHHPTKKPVNRLLIWSSWSLGAATLAGRLGQYFFLFELSSHFVVQYLVVSALLGGWWLHKRRIGLAGLMGAVLLINGVQLYPWLFSQQRETAGPGTIRILHANVLYTNPDTKRTIELIQQQQPDLFVLQEMTSESIAALKALRHSYPYQTETWSKGPCHILVGSRTAFTVDPEAVRTHHALSLQTTVRGQKMALLTVHPRTPVLPSWFRERNEQLMFVARQARRQTVPTVVVGDFNVSIFSPVYISYFLGLNACRKGFGLQPTWPRFLPFMQIPIDHAFVNNGFNTVNFQTLAQPGSDHKAVVVDLKFNLLN